MSRPPAGLAVRALGYFAGRELIPLYAFYALLFRDHGVSPGGVSSLLVIWSVTAFVLEVPSGAWADAVSRRALLVLSSVLYAAGFAIWTVAPSYPGFATGFVLWGASGALLSGTFEALLYDELAARGATAAYASLMGWANSLAMVATLAGTLLATPLFALGGYPLVGWVSVAIALGQVGLALSLPPAPRVAAAADDAIGPVGGVAVRYLAMLRAGLLEVTRVRTIRRTVLLVAVLMGLLAVDEYFPIVAREDGAGTATVPLLVAITVVGEVVGTALAGRTARLRSAVLAGQLAVAAVLLAVGVLIGGWWGFAAIGAGYGAAHNLIIVAEARLQAAIRGAARATVTSFSGLLSEVVAVGVFGGFALGSVWVAVSTLFVACAVPLAALALAVRRWLPAPAADSGARAPVA